MEKVALEAVLAKSKEAQGTSFLSCWVCCTIFLVLTLSFFF
jgi:hypothetical protein